MDKVEIYANTAYFATNKRGFQVRIKSFIALTQDVDPA